jgi:hypothetical protein
MGSRPFQVKYSGKDAKNAYDKAVDDAEAYHGHQEGYSGAINSTPGFRDVTAGFKASKKSIQEYIDDHLESLGKYDGAQCICVREPSVNKNKIKTKVEHIIEPGTKKWILKYCIYERHTDKFVCSCDKKGDAVKKAREHTEKTGGETLVIMEKSLEKGSPLVAKISYKKSTNEKDGEYVFYGWASC